MNNVLIMILKYGNVNNATINSLEPHTTTSELDRIRNDSHISHI